ncbi:hypothetical protein N9F40_00590 [bacterium]|nr:hypothetical protein [bacterium]
MRFFLNKSINPQGSLNAALRAAVWVNKEGTPVPQTEGTPQPTHVIRDVGELPGVVDALLEEDGVL